LGAGIKERNATNAVSPNAPMLLFRVEYAWYYYYLLLIFNLLFKKPVWT